MKSKSVRRASAAIAGALVFASATAAPAEITVPQVTSPLTAPLPSPYDSSADAEAAVAAAINRAKSNRKFVLLDFGGNWCADCRVLAGTLALAEVKPAVDRTFEVVMIDVGRLNKNLDLASRYHVEISAVPTVIVLDSHGRMVNNGNPAALSDARTMSTQAIVNMIFGWVRSAG